MTSVMRERGAGSGEQLWMAAVAAVVNGFTSAFGIEAAVHG
jgi:hypothetical protein